MRLDSILRSFSKYASYIPIVSTLTACVDAICKQKFEKKSSEPPSPIKNRYIRYVCKESWNELGFKAIPIIGNIAALYWDINRPKKMPKSLESDLKPKEVLKLKEDPIIIDTESFIELEDDPKPVIIKEPPIEEEKDYTFDPNLKHFLSPPQMIYDTTEPKQTRAKERELEDEVFQLEEEVELEDEVFQLEESVDIQEKVILKENLEEWIEIEEEINPHKEMKLEKKTKEQKPLNQFAKDFKKVMDSVEKDTVGVLKASAETLLPFLGMNKKKKSCVKAIEVCKNHIENIPLDEEFKDELLETLNESETSPLEEIQKFNKVDLNKLYASKENFNDLCEKQIPSIIYQPAKQFSKNLLIAHQYIKEESQPESQQTRNLINFLNVKLPKIIHQLNSQIPLIKVTLLKAVTWSLKTPGFAWAAKKAILYRASTEIEKLKWKPEEKKALYEITDILLDAIPKLDENNIIQAIVDYLKFLNNTMENASINPEEVELQILQLMQKFSLEVEHYQALIGAFFLKLK